MVAMALIQDLVQLYCCSSEDVQSSPSNALDFFFTNIDALSSSERGAANLLASCLMYGQTAPPGTSEISYECQVERFELKRNSGDGGPTILKVNILFLFMNFS